MMAKEVVYINAKRNGYAPDQCGKTFTVGELIAMLEGYDEDTPVYLKHDNGYTYGSIWHGDDELDYLDDEGDED